MRQERVVGASQEPEGWDQEGSLRMLAVSNEAKLLATEPVA